MNLMYMYWTLHMYGLYEPDLYVLDYTHIRLYEPDVYVLDYTHVRSL